MTDAADNALGDMIARLRAVPDALEGCMVELADVVDGYLRECYARGVDPDGNPWPVTELGRKPAITGKLATVNVIGSKIIVRLTWHDALHSLGTARGGKQRRLVPAGGIPPELARRIRGVVDAELKRALGAATGAA